MKISNIKRKEISESFGACNILDREKIIDQVLSVGGIEVEPPEPHELLPGVSGGKWEYKNDILYRSHCRLTILNPADGKLMSQSKNMAETIAEKIRDIDRLVKSGKWNKVASLQVLVSQIRNSLAEQLEDAGANMAALEDDDGH